MLRKNKSSLSAVLIAVIVVGGALAVFLYSKNKAGPQNPAQDGIQDVVTAPEQVQEEQEKFARIAAANAKAKEILTSPIKIEPDPNSPEVAGDAGQLNQLPCEKFHQELLNLDLKVSLVFPNNDFQFPKPIDCNTPPKELQNLFEAYSRACNLNTGLTTDINTSEGWKSTISNCVKATINYRAVLYDRNQSNVPTNDLTTDYSLQQRMLAKAAIGDFVSSGYAAARILEKDPDNYQAAKALVISRVTDALANTGEDPSHRLWSEVDASLKKAWSVAPSADVAQLGELEMLVLKSKFKDDVEAIRERASALDKDYPTNAIGPYWLAWCANKDGQPGEAARLLEEARNRDPYEPRYVSSLNALANAAAGQEVQDAFNNFLSFDLIEGVIWSIEQIEDGAH